MIERAKLYVRGIFENNFSGHDYFHTLRVLHLAETIAAAESEKQAVDMETVRLIALLHDVDDRKLSPDTCKNKDRAAMFLHSEGISASRIQMILKNIDDISYKGTDSVVPMTIEGQSVQDADRLDAMGAIGIARAFAYGGSRGRKLYDPDEAPNLHMDAQTYAAAQGHTINHFHEKLLNLKDLMNTQTGRRMAEHRHAYMEAFLEEFHGEWEGLR